MPSFRFFRFSSHDELASSSCAVNVHQLVLRNCDAFTARGLRHVAEMNKLAELTLKQCSWLKNDDLYTLQEKLGDQLTILTLKACKKITDYGFVQVGKMQRLRRLEFSTKPKVTSNGLQHLRGLEELRDLTISDTCASDEGLEHVSNLVHLERFCLSLGSAPNRVTDKGLKLLGKLLNLQVLNICNCKKITAKGLEYVSRLTNLRKLNLQCCTVTEHGLFHVSNLKNLEALDLSYCSVTDKGLLHITGLSNLLHLTLERCTRLTFVGFEHLPKNLTELNLDATYLSPKALQVVAKLEKLQRLCLRGTAGMGMKHLTALHRLQQLDLDESFISNAELAHIWNISSLSSLNLYGCLHVTDAGLAGISKLVNLRNLTLGQAITEKGLEHLSNLPRLKYSIQRTRGS